MSSTLAFGSKRIETIDFRSFVRNEHPQLGVPSISKYTSAGFVAFAAMAPTIAQAQTQDDSFMTMWGAIMGIVDWLCVGVIAFAGTSWMFGHRTNAIQLLIGCCGGYLLARHAIDIRDFLKTI